jgi:hypothetical protein
LCRVSVLVWCLINNFTVRHSDPAFGGGRISLLGLLRDFVPRNDRVKKCYGHHNRDAEQALLLQIYHIMDNQSL